MKRKLKKCRVFVIVHGKSELAICKNIFSSLRLKNDCFSDKKGAKSIQVSGLLTTLSNAHFKDFRGFQREYEDIEFYKNEPINLKIFIIMDVDDCTSSEKEQFKSGRMFSSHWLAKWIVPIYNDPNLEQTMLEIGKKINQKKEYRRFFSGMTDEELSEINESLKRCRCSNLHEFLTYCLALATEDGSSS